MVLATWTFPGRRIKLDLYASPCTKINSKRIKGLNLKPKILKLLQANTGYTSRHWDNKDFFSRTLPAQELISSTTKEMSGRQKVSVQQGKQSEDLTDSTQNRIQSLPDMCQPKV